VCQHISSASNEMIYLGDGDHMITIDNERETVVHETERFIKRPLNASLSAASNCHRYFHANCAACSKRADKSPAGAAAWTSIILRSDHD
jgi:hypothetical protein